MSPAEIPLDDLLRYESDRVEWKQSLKQTEEIYRAVCALANDLRGSGEPGFLVLGVAKDGTACGLNLTESSLDQEQQVLSNRLQSTKLLPTPSFDISAIQKSGSWLFVVRVQPYDVPPIVQVNGIAYVRSASTTVKATAADESRLRERRPDSHSPFDYRVVRAATLEDLDTRSLREPFELAREEDADSDSFPDFPRWLSQRDLGRVEAGVFAPNASALLVFGRSPQTFFPGAIVELVRYAGLEIDSPIVARRTISGPIPAQLEATWAQIEERLAEIPVEPDGIRQGFVPQYPPDALKELARNLLQHRKYDATHAPARIEWYSDRIELSNPGAPFGRASAGVFGEESDYRNPTLTKHLVELGYVQRLGRGVRLVRRQLERNGNPPLEVELDGFTRVIVRKVQ